ncbi:hypothetical protein T9H88_09280 [Staphylococcus aureus]|nr:hypothetical protein T9H88_09280 [Staphylococcus aureus]
MVEIKGIIASESMAEDLEKLQKKQNKNTALLVNHIRVALYF